MFSAVWMTVWTAFSVNCQAILATCSPPLMTLSVKCPMSLKIPPSSGTRR